MHQPSLESEFELHSFDNRKVQHAIKEIRNQDEFGN